MEIVLNACLGQGVAETGKQVVDLHRPERDDLVDRDVETPAQLHCEGLGAWYLSRASATARAQRSEDNVVNIGVSSAE